MCIDFIHACSPFYLFMHNFSMIFQSIFTIIVFVQHKYEIVSNIIPKMLSKHSIIQVHALPRKIILDEKENEVKLVGHLKQGIYWCDLFIDSDFNVWK